MDFTMLPTVDSGNSAVEVASGSWSKTQLKTARRGVEEGAEYWSLGWLGYCLLSFGMLCCCVVLITRLLHLRDQSSSSNNAPNPWWCTSLLLGTELCLIVLPILLALAVPLLIVIWTTVIIFEFIVHTKHIVLSTVRKDKAVAGCFASRARLMKSGMRIAREISGLNAMRLGFLTVSVVGMISLRSYLRNL